MLAAKQLFNIETMKRIILSITLLFTVFSVAVAQDSLAVSQPQALPAQSGSESAKTEYDEGAYPKAIELWEKEMNEQKALGRESSDLYYNLGNAYFRLNNLAKSRLYYERALLLNPGDRDIRHNIDYLSTKIEDKILVADTFFLSIWFNAIQNIASSNGWATTAIISFLLLIACLVIFFFTKMINIKKVAFYVGLVFVVIVIFANIFAYRQKQRVEVRDTAIIMTGSASVVSSPDMNSKELFILHAGTKVTITKEDRSWLEIEIDNGSVGWIMREKIEII